jgi:uncharacterized membrane protein
MDGLLFALTMATALGCGLNGGVFFTFSSFVMPGLRRIPAPQGIAAMQSINVKAVTPPFMLAFMGTGVACLVLGVWALVDWDGSYGPYLVAGTALYLVGSILLTIGYHVPRNDALEAVEAESAEGARYWARYLTEWTRANHVRAAACLGAAALLMVGITGG